MVVCMKRKGKRKIDYTIVFLLVCFCGISYLSISSAMTYLPSYLGNLALKQVLFYVLGALLAFLIFRFSNEKILKWSTLFYFGCNVLLLLLLFFGADVNGSKCWFIIPGIGSFQPSEFMKIALILVLSSMCANFFDQKKRSIKEEFFFLCKILFVVLLPSILTFLEPDTGAVFMYFMITFGILLISPLRRRWFVVALLIGGILLSFLLFLFFFQQERFIDLVGTDVFYRIDRILDWRKGEGLQLENSLTSIGSSGFWGHGYNQTPLYFPESGTDFIFSVFASNFGFIGSVFLLLLFLWFDTHVLQIAKNTKSTTNKYIIVGFLFMFCYQQVQNISMTLGLLPITGITLPFISYGGSSLLSYFIMVGILLNIFSQTKEKENSLFLNF